MARVKRSVHAHKKRRKVLEQAKGYYGLNRTHTPTPTSGRARGHYPYRDRRTRKRSSASCGSRG